MRIVAGKYRGRRLAEFRGSDVRPTPDRVKESLFQILEPRIRGARVLDLFAGTGALGLECLSREAEEAVFNDASRESLSILRKNLSLLGEHAEATCLDFRACLSSVRGQFGLIFADPPYKEEYLTEIARLSLSRGLLERAGLLVYESEREENTPAGFVLRGARGYGRTKIYLFGVEE